MMSTCVLRQATHMLVGFDSMAVPHSQHRLEKKKGINQEQNPHTEYMPEQPDPKKHNFNILHY